MALMDILAGAQGGALFATVGQATGLDAAAARKALAVMAPAIADQLKAKSEQDPSTFDALLDLLEDGADGCVIDNPEQLTNSEAVSDGNAVLDDIYGSRDRAIKTMRQLAPDVPETSLAKLSAIVTTAVLGALGKSRAPALMALTGAQTLTRGSGGILGTIVSAVVKGAVESISRKLAPRRRRRSATNYFGHKKKRSTTKRRSRSPSLEDIFGELLGTKRR